MMRDDRPLDVLRGEAVLLLHLRPDDGLGGQRDCLHVVGVLVFDRVEVLEQLLQLLQHKGMHLHGLGGRDAGALVARGRWVRRHSHDADDALTHLRVGLKLVQQGVKVHHGEAILLKWILGLHLLHVVICLLEGHLLLQQQLLGQVLHVRPHLLLRLHDGGEDLLDLLLGHFLHVAFLLLFVLRLLDLTGQGLGLRLLSQQVVEDSCNACRATGGHEDPVPLHRAGESPP
mmetsp:Transcript_44705/g.133551  ORF Transcript_44705/g.133551 Transcript_44705/m.133551 type:complete len:230 (-) Transcript_44705:72-761(-)